MREIPKQKKSYFLAKVGNDAKKSKKSLKMTFDSSYLVRSQVIGSTLFNYAFWPNLGHFDNF